MKTTFTKNTAIRLLPFLVAAATGLATFLVARYFQIAIAFSIGADVFFVMYIVMILRRMPGLTAEHLRLKARSDDLPIFIIFAVVAVVIAVAIGSLFLIINANHKHPPLELLAALLSLPLGWITIHMMAALHYAHVYWRDDEVRDARGRPVRQPVGGLSFPGGDTPPQGWDFLYFAIVIGMTAQTADVEVTTTRMRRLVIVHSVVAFFFNTIIVAAAVNLAVTLGGS
ncbi:MULTISPECIES: DUF1345 domain-containing protein [Phyllobacteriaceae]|jgi:uncharacterized membrane protein|uniref:DUF1345 domain-containing protein n=1 Tax=Mesorhizobium hungaricum TaxID=1566387 RepID=A0A1C2EB03_9HYPH|nr:MULTISPECIES: DUF1345 domain-containing protein [Mesorhizobium]MBN9235236.1 DUF1345 domain-containing protein [Mesorhizobium sp.]MDQ0332843.1 putative membrane protein [Mesorhizobium sp. YL-MeA3-2017]OCX24154.1 hypothetical protein QV13_02520 [Mesorhizobium hungaricum]